MIPFVRDSIAAGLNVTLPWYIPIAHVAVCSGIHWLVSTLLTPSHLKLLNAKALSTDEKASVLAQFLASRNFFAINANIFFLATTYVMIGLTWDFRFWNLWLVLFMWIHSGVGYIAAYFALRRNLKLPEVGLWRASKHTLVYRMAPFWSYSGFLVSICLLLYPYSPFALLVLFPILRKLPLQPGVRMATRLGLCTKPSQEILDMVDSASKALEIPTPHCVILELKCENAFAKPLENLLVLGRPILDTLDRPELLQAIVDHEMAHLAQKKEIPKPPFLYLNMLWLGLFLVAATIATHYTFLGTFPHYAIPQFVAAVLVVLIGLAGLIRIRFKLLRFNPVLATFKDRLRKEHAESEAIEEEADEFARSRVGVEVYKEALTRITTAFGEETAKRHVFGYPAFAQRVGEETPEESAVLEEIEKIEEPEGPHWKVLLIFPALLCGMFLLAAAYVGPLFITGMASYAAMFPGAKQKAALAITYTSAGHTTEALKVLEKTQGDLDLLFLKAVVMLEMNATKAERQPYLDAIVKNAKGHIVFNEETKKNLKEWAEEI